MKLERAIKVLPTTDFEEITKRIPTAQQDAYWLIRDLGLNFSDVGHLRIKDISNQGLKIKNSTVEWPGSYQNRALKSRILSLTSSGKSNDRIFESNKSIIKAINDLKSGFGLGRERWLKSKKLAAEKVCAKLPNFLVLGSPRSATTWLYDCLAVHPDVFVSPTKEPEFFGNYRYYLGENWYKRNFTGWSGERAIGDVSVGYFESPDAPTQINDVLDGNSVKLIVLLREPISRAVSYYQYRLLTGNAPRTFEQSVTMSYFQNLYIKTGHYYRYYENYVNHFSKDQILVLLHEEIRLNPKNEIKKIFDFLNIEKDFNHPVFDTVPNYAKSIRNLTLHYGLNYAGVVSEAKLPFGGKKIRSLLNRISNATNISGKRYTMKIDSDVKQRLASEFRPSNQRLQEATGIDLSLWDNL